MRSLNLINEKLAKGMIGCIRLYRRFLSPFFGKYCRFEPTCSVYSEEAISLYGPWQGGWMGVKRICRCHPFGGFGLDPVPPRDKNTPTQKP